jgi:hypothetical protein
MGGRCFRNGIWSNTFNIRDPVGTPANWFLAHETNFELNRGDLSVRQTFQRPADEKAGDFEFLRLCVRFRFHARRLNQF